MSEPTGEEIHSDVAARAARQGRSLIGIPVESQIDHRNDAHPGDLPIEAGNRFRSADYGTGTVVAVLSIGIQIHWDKPLTGTLDSHMLVHDRSYVQRLERL